MLCFQLMPPSLPLSSDPSLHYFITLALASKFNICSLSLASWTALETGTLRGYLQFSSPLHQAGRQVLPPASVPELLLNHVLPSEFPAYSEAHVNWHANRVHFFPSDKRVSGTTIIFLSIPSYLQQNSLSCFVWYTIPNYSLLLLRKIF